MTDHTFLLIILNITSSTLQCKSNAVSLHGSSVGEGADFLPGTC